MKTILPAELHKILAGHPAVTVLDVRTPAEYAAVHVPSAQNIPLDELKPEALGLTREQPVYLLCQSGQRATKAAERISRAGFSQPVVVAGGTLAWIESGLPVTRGHTNVISLERQVRIVAGSLVLTGVLLGWFVHHGFYGLSAFVGAGLLFAGLTDYCGMGLLLARMPWNKRKPQS